MDDDQPLLVRLGRQHAVARRLLLRHLLGMAGVDLRLGHPGGLHRPAPPALACANVHIRLVPAMSNPALRVAGRSEEHTSELQSLMRISYAVFCLKKKKKHKKNNK